MLINPKDAVAFVSELILSSTDITAEESKAALEILRQLEDKTGGYQISVSAKTTEIIEERGV
jgi:hypothetical protein